MTTAEHWFEDIERGEVIRSGPVRELAAPVKSPLGNLVELDLIGLVAEPLPASTTELVISHATTAGSQGS